MLDRFGEDARQVVARARDEALALSHAHVGTEHLLLGLLGGRRTPASEALVAAGASLTSAREKVIDALASRTTRQAVVADRDLPLSDRANRALDRAGRLSLRLGADEVRPEHILLSLLTVEGTAGQVLRGLAVDPDAVKEALAAPGQSPAGHEIETAEPAPSPGAATATAATPRCASCGASLAESLGRATVTVGSGPSADDVHVFYCTACGTAVGIAPR